MNILLTCILYCDAGPGGRGGGGGGIELFASTVRVVSYHGYHICPRAVFLGVAVALLHESYALV